MRKSAEGQQDGAAEQEGCTDVPLLAAVGFEVFQQADVAAPVVRVFHFPVSAREFRPAFRRAFAGVLRGDVEGGFRLRRGGARGLGLPLAPDAEDGLGVRLV